MNPLRNTPHALLFDRFRRHPDVALALLVACIVATLIVPLPRGLLDGLLAFNLVFSALILVSALLSEHTLAMSSFPSLLLLTTLLRLALNVSTTRLILSSGDAGRIIHAFGALIIGGDLAVGLVIFGALTLVQLLVVGKGAERVAEVGARFTLDAMPGKQMAIDGALRAGVITEAEAETKRNELTRESQFHGAMDGAMKFVKGDAMAGIAITAINLLAGITIGVVRFHLPVAEALDRYAILSVGDALAAQIPALLITLAAGVVTTRVATSNERKSLAVDLGSELFQSPKSLGVSTVFAILLAWAPGLPAIPFLAVALTLASAARRARRLGLSREARLSSPRAAVDEVCGAREAPPRHAPRDAIEPLVVPLGLDLGSELSHHLALTDGNEAESERMTSALTDAREALYLETGVPFPAIRVRAHARGVADSDIVVRVHEVPVLTASVRFDRALAIETPERLARLGVDAHPAQHPLTGALVSSVALSDVPVLRAARVSAWTPDGVIALTVMRVLREHAKTFVGLQETSELVERLEKTHPALVREVVPKTLSFGALAELLRRLVDERISIRDLKTIFEAIAIHGPHQSDSVLLTEQVRGALALQLGHTHAGSTGRISAMLLDPIIEDTIRGAISHTVGGSYLSLEPEIRDAIIQAFTRELDPLMQRGLRPVVLTAAEIRRYVHKLVEHEVPGIAVLSFQELPPKLIIQPHGRITLEENTQRPFSVTPSPRWGGPHSAAS